MIRLVVIFLFGSLIWMIWWAFGQVAYQKGLETWVEARRAEGWAADYASLETRGFPNRFDTTVTDVALADPETGVAWSAPFFQILSLSYKPHQVIAVLPERHRFSTPFQTVTLTHDDARASLFFQPSTLLGLDSARLVVKTLQARSSEFGEMRLAEGRLAAEAIAGPENTYRVGGEFLGLVPTNDMRLALDPGGVLPKRIETLHADAIATFTAPWDRTAIEDARPQITSLDLRDLSARWGEVTFRAVGKLTVDDQGIPTGRITVRAVEWRKILEMAVEVGAVPANLQGSLETALGLLSGPGDVLDAAFDFAEGGVSIGLIPLGAAPRLNIR